MESIIRFIEDQRERFEDELKDFLRIPSVSADSRHAADVRRAADFVAEQFKSMGLATELFEYGGPPLVYAEWMQAENAPVLLVYGHYDVQPPDPLDLWESPPFEPTVRNGNIYARGATDDKGQMFAHFKAVEAWLKSNQVLPINVKFLIEGEEEVGSEAVEKYMTDNPEKLRCDYAVISDCSMLGPDRPAITYGLKGLLYFEVSLDGPKRDLHSGSFGGSVKNPANAICEMMGALVERSGRVNLPGFYDDVAELSQQEREQFAALCEPEEFYRDQMGVGDLFGEHGFNTLERRWARPTCDVNGVFGGYQGEGAKTVIPAKAGAKVSFRLVPDQDPKKISCAFREYMESVRPPGVSMEIVEYSSSPAVAVPLESPGIVAASSALQAAFGVAPAYIREGGSIPIVGSIKEHLGVDTLLVGFGLSDDNTHSPNEKFSLKDFHRGIRTGVHLLHELANLG